MCFYCDNQNVCKKKKKKIYKEPSAHRRFFCLLKNKDKIERQKHAEMDFWNAQKASMPSGNKVVTGLTLS